MKDSYIKIPHIFFHRIDVFISEFCILTPALCKAINGF